MYNIGILGYYIMNYVQLVQYQTTATDSHYYLVTGVVNSLVLQLTNILYCTVGGGIHKCRE